MGRIDLNLPNEAQLLFNHLNADMRASDLTSDLVGIKLPDGYLIDVSWYPENDPNGQYTITVFMNDWQNKKFEHETADIREVKSIVEKMADTYCPLAKMNGVPKPMRNSCNGGNA
jgi:hypothetical protein